MSLVSYETSFAILFHLFTQEKLLPRTMSTDIVLSSQNRAVAGFIGPSGPHMLLKAEGCRFKSLSWTVRRLSYTEQR